MPRFDIDPTIHGVADAPHERPCTLLRRTMLKGLGALAAGALPVIGAGCSPPGGQLDNASGQSCGGNVCVDLASPENDVLTQVNGAALLEAPNGDTLVVIRTDATTAVALSAVCTHQGCVVDFDASRRILTCPCHGSQFSEDGSVLRGPARRALAVYDATVAEDEMTMTITL